MIFDTSKTGQVQKAISYVNDLAKLSKKVEIKEYRTKRTNLQNRYYFAILNFIAAETGNLKDDLHEYFKIKFLNGRHQEIKLKDEIDFYQKFSTTELDTKQFTDYIERISIFMADFGITIPRPDDLQFESFLEHYSNLI